jgi:hypothetical protein
MNYFFIENKHFIERNKFRSLIVPGNIPITLENSATSLFTNRSKVGRNARVSCCTHQQELSVLDVFEQPEALCLRNAWSLCLTSVEATALSSCFSFLRSASSCSLCLNSCSCFCRSQNSFRCCLSCCSCCSARCCCCC